MPKSSPAWESWNGGQLGPTMYGRASHPKYATGAKVLENWWPTKQGAAFKRPGTRFVKRAKYANKLCRLVEFEYSVDQSYVLEFGDQYMRVFKDNGAITETAQSFAAAPTAANPVVVEITGHGYSNGDEVFIAGSAMTELNSRWFTVAGATTDTFELSGENGTGRTTGTGGTAAKQYEIATPFTEANLRSLSFAQSADVLYVASQAYAPRKITRSADASWTLATIAFDWPAFRDENQDESVTIYASHATGSSRTLTASSGVFTADMVGSYVQLREVFESEHPKWRAGTGYGDTLTAQMSLNDRAYYEGRVYELTAKAGGVASGGYEPPVHDTGAVFDKRWEWTFINYGKGYALITGFTSATVVTVDIVVELPASVVTSGGATHRWSIGAWNDEYGYPGAISFFDDRLLLAGTEQDPQTWWMSRVGRYEDFRSSDEDDGSVRFTLNAKDLNRIDAVAGEDVLFMLTKGGEFVVRGAGSDETISGRSVPIARRRTRYGSRPNVAPIEVGPLLIFVQEAGRQLIALTYDEATGSYRGDDLTKFSDNIVKSGVLELKAADEPYRQVLAVQNDGVLGVLVLEPEEEVIAWVPTRVGGTAAKVESVAVVQHPDLDRNRIWAAVSRTVNGATMRHIEYFEKEWDETNDADGDEFYVDAGLTATSPLTTTIYGLDHLVGETVQVVVDGGRKNDLVVSSAGTVTLDALGTKVTIGLKQADGARWLSMPINTGAADGTALGKTGRIHRVSFQFWETGEGFKYGPSFSSLREIAFRVPEDDPDAPVPKFSGTTDSFAFEGGYTRERQVAVVHDSPLPAMMLGVYPQLVTQDRG